MKLNQRLAGPVFITGLVSFLLSLSEFFGSHDTWKSMTAPNEVSHIIVMVATFISMIWGAVSYQMPRSSNYNERVTDRISKDNLYKYNKDEMN